MAKRHGKGKGKSRRRIKDWHGRYHAGEVADEHAHRGRKVGRRKVKLPPGRLEAPEENLDDLPKRDGLVVAVYRRGATVRVGDDEMFCAIAKTFRAPEHTTALAVGDVVTAAVARDQYTDGQTDIDGDRTDGFILSRRPRGTALSRPRPVSGKRMDAYEAELFEKVIAANMDVLLIVAAVRQPRFRRRLIERFLIVAERGELLPLLVINKVDLDRPDERMIQPFERLGVEVLACSAASGEGLEALRRRLAWRRSVLAGASGVGKSTLVNALVPDADAMTRSIRAKDDRGRHTTAAAAVFELPDPRNCGLELPAKPVRPEGQELPDLPFAMPPGGLLIDTPGIRELGFAIDLAELPWYFPEFEPFVPQCRFNDCTHTHEPDCAVQAAVEAGRIPASRFESYLRMRESLEDLGG